MHPRNTHVGEIPQLACAIVPSYQYVCDYHYEIIAFVLPKRLRSSQKGETTRATWLGRERLLLTTSATAREKTTQVNQKHELTLAEAKCFLPQQRATSQNLNWIEISNQLRWDKDDEDGCKRVGAYSLANGNESLRNARTGNVYASRRGHENKGTVREEKIKVR